MTITPFTIDVPQSALDDLNERLARTRWPDQVPGAGWRMGTDRDYLQGLVDHWRTGYDWRSHEAAMNATPQFTAEIDGVRVHFVRVRGTGPNPTPLLLTHGWPDSFHRFHKVIPLLTDPAAHGGSDEESFDLVIPSIPGFAFSDRTAMSSSAVADLWAKLMTELGYERFGAAGGDVGSGVTLALARRHPERLTGIHLTDAGYPTGQEADLSASEQEFAGFIQGWWFTQGAYAMLHSTKPQTIAYSLTDSPAALAAWILSFVATGAGEDAGGKEVEAAFGGRDALLTNITIYWLTGTGGSAARMYREDAMASWGGDGSDQAVRSAVPTGFAQFPREAPTPRDWVNRQANLVHYQELPEGGHFAALEVPQVFADQLRTFFTSL